MSTATQKPPKKPEAGRWQGWEEDPDSLRDRRMTISVGVAITILFHLAIVVAMPWNSLLTIERPVEEEAPPLELEFVEYEMPKFVETNPNVTPERPEETENIAAQDQVAAQEEPDPNDNSDKPRVDGEIPDSQKIVTGDLSEPTPPPLPDGQQQPDAQEAPPVEEPTPPEPQPVEAVEEQTNTPETPEPEQQIQEAIPEAIEAESEQEQGELALETPGEKELTEPVEEPVEEQEQPKPQPKDIPKVMMEEVVPQQQQSQSGQPTPKARPRINFRVPAGPKMQQGRSANRLGQVAIDANFSEFGAYQQRMVEAISAQWNLLGTQARYTGADIGTNCVVEFTLDREGKVSNVRVLHSTSSSAGTLMTMEAIKSRAPYGPWTQDMVQVLGEQQSVRINFFYR